MHDKHMQNMTAKILRERFEQVGVSNDKTVREVRAELALVALAFTDGFARNSTTAFDPLAFLDLCSPDPDIWMLSELWEEWNSEYGSPDSQ